MITDDELLEINTVLTAMGFKDVTVGSFHTIAAAWESAGRGADTMILFNIREYVGCIELVEM